MVAISKARDVEAFLNNPDFAQKVVLLYGPDQGLVAERADLLAKKTGIDLKDPFSLIRIDADEAAADAARLTDEAHTIGMFGGKRLIRVSGSTRRDLGKAIKPVLDTPPEDAILLIEAGDLRKNSGLVQMLEKSKQAVCIRCFQDADRAIDQLIDEEIVAQGLRIDHETRAILKAHLGDNRMLSRAELVKLALYCSGKSDVSLEDVHAIVGDAAKLVIDDVVDAVAAGDPARLQKVLPKTIEADHPADMVVLAVLRHFQFLHQARTKVEQKNQTISSVIGASRPPVHFSRKDAVSRALSIWPLERIGRALQRLDKTMLDARRFSGSGPSIAGTTLLALSLEARALARRN